MLRQLSPLPTFAFCVRLEDARYDIDVNPSTMMITIEHGDMSLTTPFQVDDTKEVALLTTPQDVLRRCGEDVADQDIIGEMEKCLTLHLYCPNCGRCADKDDGFDDNGLSSASYSYTLLCLGCGHQWDPNT